MAYREALNYIASRTRVIELCNQLGGRVAICPDWNGRVMTCSCEGLNGYSFGLVNVGEIDRSESNNTGSENEIARCLELYGGEDQFTLSPDNGVFSLYHNKITSPSLNGFTEGKFTIDTEPPDPEIRMRRSVEFCNGLGTRFGFDIFRVVRLLELEEVADIFGRNTAVLLGQTDTSYVAFQTDNTILNHGEPVIREAGLVSVKIRNMLNTGIDSVAVIPFREGQEIELGASFGTDFFDLAPHNQLRRLPNAVLIKANNRHSCQIGISRSRAIPFVGLVDFRNGNMTLVSFNLPDNAWQYDYLSNAFFEERVEEKVDVIDGSDSGAGYDFVSTRKNDIYLQNNEFIRKNYEQLKLRSDENFDKSPIDKLESLYSGEVVRVYNHVSSDADIKSTFRYCEFDIFSAACELDKGNALSHQQFTLHINADNQTLAILAKEILGVNYEQTYEKTIR
ncbi:MAG: hypothetical protein LBJ67_00840 [Planctomycetaceae bacterium]|jgi:hypothetical protein|nr:hypothetical protein [Planctomycetaceae bacterium]